MNAPTATPCSPNVAPELDLDEYEKLVGKGLLRQIVKILEEDEWSPAKLSDLNLNDALYTHPVLLWRHHRCSTAEEIKSSVLKDPYFLRIFEAVVRYTSSPDIWEEAVWAIGRISARDEGFRDCIIRSGAGILNAMISRRPKGAVEDPHRYFRIFVSSFKKLLQREPLPDWGLIYPIYFSATVLLPTLPDSSEDMLSNLSWVVYHLSSAVYRRRDLVINQNIFRRLKSLLNHPSGKIKLPVIYTFRRILTQGGALANAVMSYDVLFGAFAAIHPLPSAQASTIRHEAMALVLTIVSSPEFSAALTMARDPRAYLASCMRSLQSVLKDPSMTAYSSSPNNDTVNAVLRILVCISCLASSKPSVGKSFLNSRTPEALGCWLLVETAKGSSANTVILEMILGSLVNFMVPTEVRHSTYARLLGIEGLMKAIRELKNHKMKHIRQFALVIEPQEPPAMPSIAGNPTTERHSLASAICEAGTGMHYTILKGSTAQTAVSSSQHVFRCNVLESQNPLGITLVDPNTVDVQQCSAPLPSGPPVATRINTDFLRWLAPTVLKSGPNDSGQRGAPWPHDVTRLDPDAYLT
ncbi:hypothetical protein BKA70DRAFT_1538104 [Coprinopsis sp. MPI-PUGE-AT-0042]|nr:hypothetical protein BKA70DRAFT_1538104 [Coprinopsis sp. MPI-PUGE-AT-0042]